MTEIWKDIKGYEGLYLVSNLGQVKSLKYNKERILKPCKTKTGYLMIGLHKNGKHKPVNVHRLVAQAFLDNPMHFEQVNHKDEDKTNNRVDNLEWCNAKYNNNYGTRKERAAKNKSKSNYKTVKCLETNKVYNSAQEASLSIGLNKSAVSNAIYLKCTAGGYHWKYIEKEVRKYGKSTS